MPPLSVNMLYEGVAVDVLFVKARPCFGDLFLICGEPHHAFAPTDAFGFECLAELRFSQLDDDSGVRSLAEGGTAVAVWLHPLVRGQPVHHYAGPYDGLRLSFNVLRNPARFAGHDPLCRRLLGPG